MITQTLKQEYKYLPGPRVLQIEITNKCFLNCPQCYKPPVKLLKNMTLDDFKKHVDMAADIGVKEISLLGGEPFENRNILNMIEYGVNKNIEIMTVTNGCHVGDEILERLKKINKGFTLLLSIKRFYGGNK